MIVGTRVQIVNPKSVAHLSFMDMRPIGFIREIDPSYFAESIARHTYGSPDWIPWANDVPQVVRNDKNPTGFYVVLDDCPQNTVGVAYRQSELKEL